MRMSRHSQTSLSKAIHCFLDRDISITDHGGSGAIRVEECGLHELNLVC